MLKNFFFWFFKEAFISLMGREKYETFGDAIQQLKFCEEFAERSLWYVDI